MIPHILEYMRKHEVKIKDFYWRFEFISPVNYENFCLRKFQYHCDTG